MKIVELDNGKYTIVSDNYGRTVEVVSNGSITCIFSAKDGCTIQWYGWKENDKDTINTLCDAPVVREVKKIKQVNKYFEAVTPKATETAEIHFKYMRFKESGKWYETCDGSVNITTEEHTNNGGYYWVVKRIRELKTEKNDTMDWLIGAEDNWFVDEKVQQNCYPVFLKGR